MALYHFHVTQIRRSAGQSAIASAAYRSGEKLYSEYYGETSDYSKKKGVICSEILLPPNAPLEYADRQTIWNALEQAEQSKDAQLAYSFDIALQNEFSLEENIALARQFVSEQLVSRGMIADLAIHMPDKEIQNPHFHILCPIRPLKENGKWGYKQHRVYHLNEQGNRILDENGNGISVRDEEYEWVDLNTPFWDFEKPPRETLREFDKYWRQYWKEREKQYTDMDKAFYAVEEDGQEYFYIGKTRIKITEHFPEKGRTMGELIEDLILYAARQDEKADDGTHVDSSL